MGVYICTCASIRPPVGKLKNPCHPYIESLPTCRDLIRVVQSLNSIMSHTCRKGGGEKISTIWGGGGGGGGGGLTVTPSLGGINIPISGTIISSPRY